MEPPAPYDQTFFDAFEKDSRKAARLIAPVLLDMVSAESAIDVGGGRGIWLSVLKEFGVTDVLGIDGDYVQVDRLAIGKDEFLASDLEKPLKVDRRADVAISLETAEHLSEGRADSFVEDLCRLSDVVLFSAAVPRQGGTNHINERWQSYWAAKFAKQGYRPSDVIRQSLWDNQDAGAVYLQNALIYANEAGMARYPKLKAAIEATNPKMLDVVHPLVMGNVEGLSDPQRADFVGLSKMLPFAMKKSLRRWGGRQLRALGLRKGAPE